MVSDRLQITFISNTPIQKARGGWDGLGGKVYELLKKRFPTTLLIEELNPEISFLSKFFSKAFRVIGLKGSFPVFNKSRLKNVADLVGQKVKKESNFLFFHGATPWIYVETNKPYCALLDCCFMTYMSIYHKIDLFSKTDLRRIAEKERSFLEKAHSVFFTTQWALEETKRLYQLHGDNFMRVGQGPSTHTEPNQQLMDVVRNQFLFIGTDFLGKGGAAVCNSFQKLIKDYPDYELVIVGQTPPDAYLQGKNIRFLGFINKSTPEGLKQLEQLYKESKALVMQTKKDIAPLVVIEAGLQGCITIANKVTALGEMIIDQKTGYLIESDEDQLLDAMKKVASLSADELKDMRTAARTHLIQEFTWQPIMEKMIASIQQPAVNSK